MTPCLLDLQRRFAAELTSAPGPHPGIALYRNTVRTNYRNALGATYRVVREIVGDAAFADAVDAFARDYPSTGGDLNVYGGEFAPFLEQHRLTQPWPHVPDVARLEWALDEAHRAADADGSAERTFAALAGVPGAQVAQLQLVPDPSCRMLRSRFPVLRIWRGYQDATEAIAAGNSNAGIDLLLIRRDSGADGIERLCAGDHAWMDALVAGADLAGALDAALSAEATFDLTTALRTYIGNGTLTGIARHDD